MPGFRDRYGSDADDLRWEDYEELVKDIYEALGKASGVTIKCWGRTCRVRGQSGVSHQIDVLTTHTAGLHQYRTAVSCKHWNRNVGKAEVVEFAEILRDATLNKGVIVSKIGFTRHARKYAEFKGIGLIELRKPLDSDWDGHIREVHGTVVLDVGPSVENLWFRLAEPESRAGGGSRRLLAGDVLVCVPGQEAKTFRDLFYEERSKHPDREDHDVRFPEGSKLKVPDQPQYPPEGFALEGISFTLRDNPPRTTEFAVRADDHIYMIMESVFDGHRFALTKDGKIIENKP